MTIRSIVKSPWCATVSFTMLFPFLGASCGSSGEHTDDWTRHDAHRRCSAAIAAYPEAPAPPCRAMHMCANEARLTAAEQDKLQVMIRATDGCDEP
jgi:hypothetical protein